MIRISIELLSALSPCFLSHPIYWTAFYRFSSFVFNYIKCYLRKPNLFSDAFSVRHLEDKSNSNGLDMD